MSTDSRPWWSMTPEATLDALGVSNAGLSPDEAAQRLETEGPNELDTIRGTSVWMLIVRQFLSPLIYILLIAAVVSLLLQEFIDAGIIMAILVLNAIIGFTQEYQAERSMEALRRLATASAHVVRGGRPHEIDSREVVPGDVVLLEAGMKVPADCRLLHTVSMEADESLLTGESVTVVKDAAGVDAAAAVADRTSMAYMGTVVTRGRGRGVVTATARATEIGRIARSVEAIAKIQPPLVQRMDRFARIIGVAILGASLLGFAIGFAAGEEPEDLFLTLVALAVAAIPEGLPIVLTITLAIGVNRMAARNAVIRRLPAVETLGSCTVIGSDKTGTLTQNRMTVERVHAGGRDYRVTGGGYGAEGEVLLDGAAVRPEEGGALSLTLRIGALCNDGSIIERDGVFDVRGEPTELALLVAAWKAGIEKDDLEERYPRVAEVPFDSQRQFAATFHELDGRLFAAVKGAPERVLAMCHSAAGGEPLDRDRVLQQAREMADNGLRVLAMAYAELEETPSASEIGELVFAGLQGMMDPPRDEVKDAVLGCRRAGVRPVMVTGDHANTALAVARQLEIAAPEEEAFTGAEIDDMTDEELDEAVAQASVFARVAPEQKLRIVESLRRMGHVVAVTGDGVNDGPALRAADIGVAMGLSGTDVAKEAADMVVTDDNFASIFSAVEEGRVAFDNVRKVTFFLIATGAGTVVAVLASLIFRFELPLLPAQLLWLNLVTNGVQDVALAFEPGEKGALERPPRPRKEGIISPLLWERTALAGLVLAGGTLLLYLLELQADTPIEEARTVALTTLVLFQVFHVGNSRSEHLSAFAKSPFSNRLLFVGTAIALAIHIGAIYLPPTQYILRIEPLALHTWFEMVAVASSVIIVVELHKLLRGPGKVWERR